MKLFINNIEIDYSSLQDLKLAITFDVGNLVDLKRNSSYSKTITIPATATNRRALGFPENIDMESTFNQQSLFSAKVESTTTIFEGYAKLIKATRNEYELILIGDNGQWINGIKNLSLQDLDYSGYNVAWTYANILDAASNDAVKFPLIDRGAFVPNYNGLNCISVMDLLPAFQVKQLLIKIFKAQAYNYSSNFIDNIADDLYLPFCGQYPVHSDSWKEDRTLKLKNTNGFILPDHDYSIPYITLDASGTNYYDNPGWLAGFNAIKPDQDIYYKFNIKAKGTFSDSNLAADLLVRIIDRDGYTTTYFPEYGWDMSLGSPFISNENCRSQGVDWYLNYTTQRIYVPADGQIQFFIWHGNTGETLSIGAGDFEVEAIPTGEHLFGDTLEINNFMPDINQSDLIQALKQMYNLYFYTDVNKRIVYIETRDDFYNGISSAVDWSDKIDMESEIVVSEIEPEAKKYIYKYKDDSDDAALEKYEDATGYTFGESTKVFANVWARGDRDIENKLFSPTIMAFCKRSGVQISSIPLPKLWTNIEVIPERKFDFNFRILKKISSPSSYNIDIVENATAKSNRSESLFTFMVFYDDTQENDNSLLFKDISTSYGLVKKYYENTHDAIDDSRYLTAMLYLTASDINDFDFRNPVFLDIPGVTRAYYNVLQINDYQPEIEQTVKVNFVKVTDIKDAGQKTWTPSDRSEAEIGFLPLGSAEIGQQAGSTVIQDTYGSTLIDVDTSSGTGSILQPIYAEDSDGEPSIIYAEDADGEIQQVNI